MGQLYYIRLEKEKRGRFCFRYMKIKYMNIPIVAMRVQRENGAYGQQKQGAFFQSVFVIVDKERCLAFGYKRYLGIEGKNRQKSKTRSRVEHVFGFMEQTMGGLVFRGVGIVRAKANIALTNLVYNMCRLVQIQKYHPDWMLYN